MTKDEALSAKHEGATTVALKLALEALEYNQANWQGKDKAITAIKETLAQPDVDRRSTESKETFDQQEPVVWMYQNKSTHEVRFQKHMRSFVDHGAWYEVPLYSEPLANQEKTSGSPKPAKTEALRLADAMEYDLDWCDEAAAELRRMHDLLGKANALCRIRAEEIERLKAQPEHSPNCALLKIPSKDCDCQDQQEPVAITITGKLGNIYSFTGDYSLKKGDKVYTTPPKAQPEQKYRRGDRLVCLETDEYCVIHIAGTDRQWVKFPDTHIGVYTNEQVDQLFEKLARETDLAEPEQEPAAWVWKDGTVTTDPDRADGTWRPLYITPPQRTWVGLTDEEVFDVWLNEMPAPDKVFYQKLCRSVEAKLKEKNT